MKYLITSFCCLFSMLALGQMVDVIDKPSGYFGKRFLFGFSGSFGASYNYQKAYAVTPERSVTLNRDFSASCDYTVTNSRSIGFILGNGRTSFDPEDVYYPGYNGDIIIYDEKGKAYAFNNALGSPLIKDKQIGVVYKSYRSKKGAFSPIGQYYCIGLSGHFYTADFSEMSYSVFTQNSPNTIVIKSNLEPLKFVLPEIYVGAGFSKPILKNLFLDASFKLGYLRTFDDENVQTLNSVIVDYFKQEMKSRLRNREIFNMNFGLAYPF